MGIGAGAVCGAFLYELGESVLPRTEEILKKISIPKHNYRSDLDFFLVTVIPVLKHPALAFYEDMAPPLCELLAKTRQQQLDRGLSNAVKALIAERNDWEHVANNSLKMVTAFKKLIVGYSVRIKSNTE